MINEVEESEKEEEPLAVISSKVSIMSTVTEDTLGGSGGNKQRRDDSRMYGDACLLLPRPEESVFLPSPRLIGISRVSGEQGTKRWEGGWNQSH